MIKGFMEWINESSSSQELEDIRHLADLGMINNQELIHGLIEISNRTGENVSDLFRPEDRYYSITAGNTVDPDSATEIEDWLKSWQGPLGELVIQATGLTEDGWFEVDLVLSSGAKVHLEWNDSVSGNIDTLCFISVGGKITHMTREDYLAAADHYYGEDRYYGNSQEWDEWAEWEEYMHKLLTLTVESSY
jgi:hypothetical protein